MPFRLSTKQLFLTYPQCNLSKENAWIHLEELLRPKKIIQYVVAHELHLNGDDHLHCYIKLEKVVETQNEKYFDLPKTLVAADGDNSNTSLFWHGNYQGCRSMKNVLKYCTKKEDYISNFDVDDVLNKGSNTKKIIAQQIMSGLETELTILEKYPQYLFGFKRFKEDIDLWRSLIPTKKVHLPYWIPNPWGYVLPYKRNQKRRHYWIFSTQPNKGKTTFFAEPLVKEYNIHFKTGGEFTYWNLRGDEEGIILDEYNHAYLKWDKLNSMADGLAEYRRCGSSNICLKKPLLIILSNRSIKDLYPNRNDLLYARFNEKEIL